MDLRSIVRVTVVASVLIIPAACSAPSAETEGTASGVLLPGDAPVAHPVHSPNLMAAMAELENLALEELSANLESDATPEARLDKVERIADALASSISTLPGFLEPTDLPAEKAARFRALADQLGRDVVSLRNRARLGNVEGPREEREVLLKSCNTCHAEFRVLSQTDDER